MITKERRLEWYKQILQLMENDPEMGVPGTEYDGICCILYFYVQTIEERIKTREWLSSYILPELFAVRTRKALYWFNNREERLEALRYVIENFESLQPITQ